MGEYWVHTKVQNLKMKAKVERKVEPTILWLTAKPIYMCATWVIAGA